MRKKLPLFAVLIFLTTLAQGADLQVVSAKPKGEQRYTGSTAVSVTFNQPVTSLSEESAFAAEDCPLQITPKVEGTCRFSGTQTLQFEPAQDWPLATQYKVTVPATFTSKVSGKSLSKDYQWSFDTPRPTVQQVIPYNGEQWIDVRPRIYVLFSQPVQLDSAKEAISLRYMGVKKPSLWARIKAFFLRTVAVGKVQLFTVPVHVRSITDEEHDDVFSYEDKDRILVVEPRKDLPVHSSIDFVVSKALRGQVGNLGPKQDFRSVFYTYPKLEVAGGKFDGCLPYNAHLNFTSPVRMSDLLKHITVSPKTALVEVNEQEAQTLGYQRTVSAEDSTENADLKELNLQPGKGYFAMPLSFLRLNPKQKITLTLDKKLTDIYGQKLGKKKVIEITNDGYCPTATFKGGLGVLESYLKLRHPIDVLNEKELLVYAGRFNKENFIPFQGKYISYCSRTEINKANLQYDAMYPFSIMPDKAQKTYLDLNKFNPTSRDSIIFSQVRIPVKYREDGYCWISATDNITDLGVTLKTSGENVLVWVTSLKDGQPKENMQVELRDISNRTLWKGTSDKNGIATAPGLTELSAKKENRWDSRPAIYAFVTSEGGDAVLASTWNDGLQPWRFNVPFDYSPQASAIKTALFTERGIYRPGETVYIKGVTRQQKQGNWALPNATKGTLKIYNSRGDEVVKQTVYYVAGTGAFDWKYKLPAEAVTGSWQLYFTPDGAEDADAYYSFQVEAVKQAEFEVHLRALQENYVAAKEAKFTASADYLFGAPVSDGKAKWSVRSSRDWFEPKEYEGYQFIPYFLIRDEKHDEDALLTQASGTLDENGKIDFSVTLPKVTTLTRIYGEVGVQAPSGQQLFARTYTTLHPADFYLGSKMERWATEMGEPAQAHIVAVDLKGQAIGPVKVKAEIKKEEYFSIRKNGLAGRLEWVSDRRVKDMGKQSFTVPEKGYNFSFLPKEPGSYQITLSAKDAQGHLVRGGFSFTVYGKGEAYWRQNDDDILSLKQDKDTYTPGENARILVESPYDKATALVTVERNGILDSWVQPITSGADYIEVPVKASYAPNVFVGVTLVRGRAAIPAYDKEGLDLAKPQGKTGYVRLNISQKEKEIDTQVKTDKTHYLPGETVSLSINTKAQNKPVAADVTVMVVDDGVLSLTGYKMPNLLKVFYSPLPLSVLTADNRLFLIGQRDFGEKGENRGGGGGLLNKLGGADLRSHFEFAPYFNARVKTNANGQASLQFKLPDNLTSFRVMAVAATVQKFGAGETTIKVSKPLMITPKMPRFARRDDQFQCGAIVYNYEDEKGLIQVSAEASGALKLDGGTKEIKVAKGGAQEVNWPCHALEPGEAKIAFAAVGADSKDGVLLNFPVTEVEKQQTLSLYSATDNSEEQLLEKPRSINEKANNKVTVSMASTALLNLRGAIHYLLTYPYDCLEQKMSKILPVIEGAKMVEDFKLADLSEYKKKTQEILNEIPKYQTAAGGLAYWPGMRPDAYVTAYALETAYRAKKAGYQVPQDSLQKAANWLKTIFNDKTLQAYPYSFAERKTSRAYGVYVLALYGINLDAQFNNLYSERNALTVPAQSYLLLAAQALNKDETVQDNLAQELLNKAQYGAQTMHFSSSENQPWLHMEDVKVTALALEALLQVRSNLLSQPYQAVRWLLEQMNVQGYWKNTSSNAAVFNALNAYYRQKEAQEPNFQAILSKGGQELFSGDFRGRSLQTKQKDWAFKQFYQEASDARVKLSKSGEGTLYYSLGQIYTPLAYTNDVNAGFSVSRQITNLEGKAVTSFKAGERYKVTMKVKTSQAYSFVVLEDFIPAGFELVLSNLATESQEDAQTTENASWGSFEREEKYDDRIAAFADYLSEGEHSYSYLVQASVAGTFSYPSLWASQMYDPAVFGRNATSSIEIKP